MPGATARGSAGEHGTAGRLEKGGFLRSTGTFPGTASHGKGPRVKLAGQGPPRGRQSGFHGRSGLEPEEDEEAFVPSC